MPERLWPDSADKNEDLSPLKKGALGEKFNEGSHANIHEINSPREDYTKTIVKIGKTEEYAPPLLKALKLSFPRAQISRILEKTLGPEFKIDVDQEFIKNGVAEYLLIKSYFGADTESLEKRKELIAALENPESQFYQELAKGLGSADDFPEFARLISQYQGENFLSPEQTVVGHPEDLNRKIAEEKLSRGEKLPVTYYIFQDSSRREGVSTLFDMSDAEIAKYPEIIEKLLVFALITKKMYSDTGNIIDTRPDELLKNPLEWFQKTSNIRVDKKSQKIFFVDTRWLWKKDSRLGEKGVNLVGLLGVRSVDRAIRKYSALSREAKE